MRGRAISSASSKSSADNSVLMEQELDSLYDFLAKIIILGPSGCGKSCILHRFVKGSWKVLVSQTIGVEFSSKIIKVGQGSHKRNIKLQLWDTAGQERFRSLTRGYYRGSAGVLLVYDIANRDSFEKLPEFIADIRALTSPNVSIVLVGNKKDLKQQVDHSLLVSDEEAVEFCIQNGDIPFISSSAFSGENIDELFDTVAAMILTKIETGAIDPEDMDSGVQYGQVPRWDSTLPKNSRSLIGLIGGSRRNGDESRSSYSGYLGSRSNCC